MDNSEIITLYGELVKAPQTIFGVEGMTQDVMIKAIDTAGYIVWNRITNKDSDKSTDVRKAGRRL